MSPAPRVLVLEDEEALRSMLSMMFSRRGWDVTPVGTGQAALDVADGRHDLILLDLGLSDVNGVEVCRRLRERRATALTPIIMVTGRDDPRDVRDGRMAGADEFVTKPFELVGLMATVERVLAKSTGTQSQTADEPAARH